MSHDLGFFASLKMPDDRDASVMSLLNAETNPPPFPLVKGSPDSPIHALNGSCHGTVTGVFGLSC